MRPPLGVELTYRSEAALLVAYSAYLVKGQLPIDTTSPFSSGTPLAIRLVAPSTTINMAGVVAWTRDEAQGPGQPAGMGITLAASADRIGAAIDKLAFEFRGIKALVAASQAAPRALLIRYLRSIITCNVIEVEQAKLAEPGALSNVDLTVIDLDSAGPAGYELYAHLRAHPEAGTAPCSPSRSWSAIVPAPRRSGSTRRCRIRPRSRIWRRRRCAAWPSRSRFAPAEGDEQSRHCTSAAAGAELRGGDRVGEQHGDRHRPDAAGDRGDRGGARRGRGVLDVAQQLARPRSG